MLLYAVYVEWYVRLITVLLLPCLLLSVSLRSVGRWLGWAVILLPLVVLSSILLNISKSRFLRITMRLG